MALGYDLAAFTPLTLSEEDKQNLEIFSKKLKNSAMPWFGRYLTLRQNPTEIYEGTRSALVLASYYRDLKGEKALQRAKVHISRYAHGKDYHRVLRKKAKNLISQLKNQVPELEARICVDSAPVP